MCVCMCVCLQYQLMKKEIMKLKKGGEWKGYMGEFGEEKKGRNVIIV